MCAMAQQQDETRVLFGPQSEAFLRRLLWLLVALMVLMVLQSLWVYPGEFARTFDKLGIVAVAVVGLVLLRRWGVVAALKLVLWGIWIVVSLENAGRYGIRNGSVLVYPLFVILSAWLLGYRQALAMALATSVVAVGLAWAEGQGWYPPLARSNVWVMATVLVVVMLLGAVISSNMYFHMREQHQQTLDLAHSLEVRVAERTRHLATVNAELESTLLNLQRTQRELVQSEKLASLGSMVAGVAHELNTPIGNAVTAASTLSHAVEDFAQRAQEKSMARSTISSFVQTSTDLADLLLRSTQRAAELVASFKRVAVDRTSEQRREFDLLNVVQELLHTLAPTLRRLPWAVVVEVPEGVVLDSYPGPLEQVLTNLILNASNHAFGGRASGTISLRARHVTALRLVLDVSDDGCGMAPEVLARVFEPFFTTKLGQGGSGLGLSISHNIVTQVLGGELSVQSQPGRGAVFTIDIPLRAPDHEGGLSL